MTESGLEIKPGWMWMYDATLRSVLHIDPDTLSDEMWVHQVIMAQWSQAQLRKF